MYKEITKNFEIQIILVGFVAICIYYKKSRVWQLLFFHYSDGVFQTRREPERKNGVPNYAPYSRS